MRQAGAGTRVITRADLITRPVSSRMGAESFWSTVGEDSIPEDVSGGLGGAHLEDREAEELL